MGDFPGLTEKLDYLRDLGITAIWLLPFSPSPGKDDWLDISNYLGVHPGWFSGARIIFQDFETSNWAWDPVAKACYWHRFYSHPRPHRRSQYVARGRPRLQDRCVEWAFGLLCPCSANGAHLATKSRWYSSSQTGKPGCGR